MNEMLDSTIDLGSLCVLVVVVVCSWGVALLCSITCWNSYKKSRPNHLYCTQCSTLAGPPIPVTNPVTIPSLRYYYDASKPQYNPCRPLSHTAERLGILEPDNQSVQRNSPNNSSGRGDYPAFPRARCGASVEVLETIHVPSPVSAREQDLDHNTTISRSFRSAKKRCSNGGRSIIIGTTAFKESPLCLTLNERFGTLSGKTHGSEEASITAGSAISAQSILSQVRIISSPPHSVHGDAYHALTRTPSNAMKTSEKSLYSSRSAKSGLGYPRKTLSKERSKIFSRVITKNKNQKLKTSEANLLTSDEDVFVSDNQRNGKQVGHYHVTPVNPEIVTRQFSQEQLHRPKLITPSSGGSDWTNPRKERQVGSPGNTANADFFIKQHTPQVMDIDIDNPGKYQRLAKTDFEKRIVPNKLGRSGVINSAPVSPARKRFMDSRTQSDVDNHNRLNVKSRGTYKPGYSESDLTSQSEDEARRRHWDRRGALEPELPPQSPEIRFDLTPPVLDLSLVVPSISSTVPPPAPLYTTSALSTDPSPLQYSSVSFLQSDMSLVLSPTTPARYASSQSSHPVSLDCDNYASSQSSHPVSLDWDNYASDPQFKQHN